jgi:shikimate kinase
MNVVLIGMKHCGKSTLGAALAQRWACPFHDVDRLIEQQQVRETGHALTVREIFTQLGERRFDELEAQAVTKLHTQLLTAPLPQVVALGGRTALNDRVSALLPTMGLIVYLEVSAEEMFQRVLRGGLPPWLNQEDPVMDFLELYKERIPHYQQLADLTVNLNGLDVPAALEKLCRELDRVTGQTSRA